MAGLGDNCSACVSVGLLGAYPPLRWLARSPTEREEHCQIANGLEKRAAKRDEALAKYHITEKEKSRVHKALLNSAEKLNGEFDHFVRHNEEANKCMAATHLSMIAATTGLPITISIKLLQLKVRMDINKIDCKRPEHLAAEAQCWREIAGALRKGRYKGKLFTCKPTEQHE